MNCTHFIYINFLQTMNVDQSLQSSVLKCCDAESVLRPLLVLRNNPTDSLAFSVDLLLCNTDPQPQIKQPDFSGLFSTNLTSDLYK